MNKRGRSKSTGIGLAMGVAMGVAIGVAMDNVGAGIAIGVAIGAGLGSTGAFESKNLDPEDLGGPDESGVSAESGDLGDQASEEADDEAPR